MPYLIVILFVLFPVASIPMLGFFLARGRFESRWLCGMLAFSLGLVAYSFVPDQTKDLYKHYQATEKFSGSFEAYLEYAKKYGSHLSYYLFYLASLLGAYNLVSLVFVSVSYYFNFRFIRLCLARGKVDGSVIIALALLLFSTHSFPVTISTLRQPLAVSLFLYAILYADVNKKHKWICLILPVFLHMSILPIFCVYMMLYILEKGKMWAVYFGLIAVIFIGLAWEQIYSSFSEGLLVSKARGYSQISSLGGEGLVLNIFVGLCLLLSIVVIVRLHSQNRLFQMIRGSLYVKLSLVFIVMIILVIPYPVYFYRAGSYLPFFVLPLLAVAFRGGRDLSYNLMIAVYAVTVFFAIRLQYANFGGYHIKSEAYYSNALSILVNLKNCFF